MDLSTAENIVVIGGGQAGAQAVQSLRLFGYEGGITMVGDETALPYQRPPLSKAYMKGEMAEDRLYFKPAAWYEDNKVETLLSQRVEKIDRSAREVHLLFNRFTVRSLRKSSFQFDNFAIPRLTQMRDIVLRALGFRRHSGGELVYGMATVPETALELFLGRYIGFAWNVIGEKPAD